MTERSFEVDGQEVTVKVDGRVQRSPVPKGFDPKAFRHVLAAIDALYSQKGTIPSVNDVVQYWPQFDRKMVTKAFAAPELSEALALRGIQFDASQGLSAEQLAVIKTVSNPVDGRALSTKLASHGVPMSRYRAWMRNPLFSKMLSDQAELNIGDAIPLALNKLIANAEAGSERSIEKLLEISGRWNPQQQEVQNAKTVVMIVLEAVQKHVDRDTLKSIMDEVTAKQQAITITQGMAQLQEQKEIG